MCPYLDRDEIDSNNGYHMELDMPCQRLSICLNHLEFSRIARNQLPDF